MAYMPPSVGRMTVSFLLIAGREAAEEPLTMRMNQTLGTLAKLGLLPAIKVSCRIHVCTSGQGRRAPCHGERNLVLRTKWGSNRNPIGSPRLLGRETGRGHRACGERGLRRTGRTGQDESARTDGHGEYWIV